MVWVISLRSLNKWTFKVFWTIRHRSIPWRSTGRLKRCRENRDINATRFLSCCNRFPQVLIILHERRSHRLTHLCDFSSTWLLDILNIPLDEVCVCSCLDGLLIHNLGFFDIFLFHPWWRSRCLHLTHLVHQLLLESIDTLVFSCWSFSWMDGSFHRCLRLSNIFWYLRYLLFLLSDCFVYDCLTAFVLTFQFVNLITYSLIRNEWWLISLSLSRYRSRTVYSRSP